MALFKTPKHPIRKALKALVGKRPPAFVRGYNLKSLSDRERQRLEEWTLLHSKPFWAVPSSILEAAESIVLAAVRQNHIEYDKSSEENKGASERLV